MGKINYQRVIIKQYQWSAILRQMTNKKKPCKNRLSK